MAEHSPPQESLETPTFGSYLRNERKQAGLTLRALTARSNFAVSTLSRWENDKVIPVRADVAKIDRALDARGRLLSAWEALTSTGIPPWMRSPGILDERSIAIDALSVSLVPGIVQSPEYARAVFRAGRPTAPQGEIERLAQLRVGRYESLTTRNNPLVTVVFPIHTLLYLPRVVKEDQVRYLLRHMDRERLVVYLIPDHVPILSTVSSAQVYRLRDGVSVAVSDHVLGNVLLEKPGNAESVQSLLMDLVGLASPRTESATLLEGLL